MQSHWSRERVRGSNAISLVERESGCVPVSMSAPPSVCACVRILGARSTISVCVSVCVNAGGPISGCVFVWWG